MKTQLTITVSAPQGSSKSTAMAHLEKFLLDSGWVIKTKDQEPDKMVAEKAVTP